MNRNEQFLSLIGLCLRGRNLEVGEEPVEAVARARDARVLLLASDAADNTARRVRHFAEAGQCVWLRSPFTKQELGQATGRGAPPPGAKPATLRGARGPRGRGALPPEARCGNRNPTLSSILATQMPCRSCRSGA